MQCALGPSDNYACTAAQHMQSTSGMRMGCTSSACAGRLGGACTHISGQETPVTNVTVLI